MANAVLNSTSLPSINIKSHTRSTQFFGKHVQNNVKNHCIVKTFINGGSKEPANIIHSFILANGNCMCLFVVTRGNGQRNIKFNIF